MRNLIASSITLLTIGCSSLLGLDDFEDAPAAAGGAGAGGTAGSAPTGGAGGTAGAAGTGGLAGAAGSGGAPSFVCNPTAGPPDVLFSAADLGSFKLNPSSLSAVSGPEYAHFGILGDDGGGSQKFFVRSVRQSSGGWLSNFTSIDLPAATGGSTKIKHGASSPQGPFAFWGIVGNSVARLAFTLAGGNGVQPGSGKLDALPTPPACTQAQSGFPDGTGFSPQANGTLRYAVSCRQPNKVSLFVVDTGGTPPAPLLVEEKTYAGQVGEDLRAESYTYVSGQHVVLLGAGNVRYGADPAKINKGVWKLTGEASLASVGLLAVATPDQTGALFVGAAVDFNSFSKGEVYSGVVAPADWPKLFQTPSPVMSLAANLTNGQEFPMLETWAADSETIVMAANDLSGANVRFWHLSRTGKINVVNQAIYTVSDTSSKAVLRAAGARAGAHYYAAWLEQQNGQPDTLYGKGVICTGQL